MMHLIIKPDSVVITPHYFASDATSIVIHDITNVVIGANSTATGGTEENPSVAIGNNIYATDGAIVITHEFDTYAFLKTLFDSLEIPAQCGKISWMGVH